MAFDVSPKMKAQSWFTSSDSSSEKIEKLRSIYSKISDDGFFDFYGSYSEAEADLGGFVELINNSIDCIVFDSLEELLNRDADDEFYSMYPNTMIFASDSGSHLIGYDLRSDSDNSIILFPRDNEEFFSAMDVLASSMIQLLDLLGHPHKTKSG